MSKEQAILDAKTKFMPLFESINTRYIAELRNNPDTEADFTYSEFSMSSECIRTDKGHNKKFPL